MTPPVCAPFVPPRSVLGAVARFSYWPLAFVGARAISVAHPNTVAFVLILGSLVASSMSRRAPVLASAGGGVLAAIAAFAATRVALTAMHASTVVIVIGAVAVGLAAGLSFARTLAVVRDRVHAPLDVNAVALAPIAAWMAISAVSARYGAEAVHFHVVIPTTSLLIATIAAIVGAIGVITFVRQARWTRRVYRNEAPPLTVSALPDGIAVDSVDALSTVAQGEAVIAPAVENLEPYRSQRDAIARVPSTPDALLRDYARRSKIAAGATLAALVAIVLVGGSRAKVADAAENVAVPATLPPLPGECAAAPPTIRFVALAPLHLMDIEAIAERYRRAGLADVRVEAPLPFEDRFYNPERAQLIGEEIAKAAYRAYEPRDHQLVIVVTDFDMHLRSTEWRYAFATGDRGVSVISLARMQSSFPWLTLRGHALRAPECTALLRARAFKMITRSILRVACHAMPEDDPLSLRRYSVLSLDDLDLMNESVY
jgi:hypothetical protein